MLGIWGVNHRQHILSLSFSPAPSPFLLPFPLYSKLATSTPPRQPRLKEEPSSMPPLWNEVLESLLTRSGQTHSDLTLQVQTHTRMSTKKAVAVFIPFNRWKQTYEDRCSHHPPPGHTHVHQETKLESGPAQATPSLMLTQQQEATSY